MSSDIIDRLNMDIPPPRPPKPSVTKSYRMEKSKIEMIYSSDDEYEPVTYPQHGNEASKRNYMPLPNEVSNSYSIKSDRHISGNEESVLESEEEPPIYDEINEEDMFNNEVPVSDKVYVYMSAVPKTFKTSLKRVQQELFTKVKRIPLSVGSKKNAQSFSADKEFKQYIEETDEEQDDNVYPDILKLNVQTVYKRNNKQQITEPPLPPKNSVKPKSYRDSLTVGMTFDKPIGKIVPTVLPELREDAVEISLDSMTVEQLYMRLVDCGLPDLAASCQKEKIDGEFICSFNNKDLKEMFSLTDLHLKKIERIKSGWKPRH